MRIVLVLLLALLASCSEPEADRPSRPPLDEATFVSVLVDLHFYDALLLEANLYDKNLAGDSTSYYAHLYAKHAITREQFDQTLAYYKAQPDELVRLYRQVLDQLNMVKDALPKQE